MTRASRVAWVLLATFALAAGVTGAAELTPAAFVACDLQARTTTNRGMQTRLSLISSGAAAAALSSANADTEAAVNAVYSAFGTSASKHAVFGTQHAKKIQALIDADPLLQQEYARLKSEFTALSQQLTQALGRN